MQLLTLVSDDWSIHRTMEFLKGSEYSVKAKKLKKEKGILATPRKYSREGIQNSMIVKQSAIYVLEKRIFFL